MDWLWADPGLIVGQFWSWCRRLIVAKGIIKPNIPQLEVIEYVDGYETMSLDPNEYEGQTVLILGKYIYFKKQSNIV